jgi:hypothetical protein
VHTRPAQVAVDLDRELAGTARANSEWQLRPLDREVPDHFEIGQALPDLDLLEPIRKKLLAF